MTISARVTDERVLDVRCDEASLIVDLMDGRTISVPLAWYPRLLHATAEQRAEWEKAGGGYGIHWPGIDEDLSTEGIVARRAGTGEGRVIPAQDYRGLRDAGVQAIFGPGTNLVDAAAEVLRRLGYNVPLVGLSEAAE